MAKLLDTVLLLALPASGKSEVREFLDNLSPEQCMDEFGIGPTLQLDDYPYVHFMHRIDDELVARGQPNIFYLGPERPFTDNFEWGTLIHLLNEDYDDLQAQRPNLTPHAAQLLFDRIDRARAKVGLPRSLGEVPYRVRSEVAEAMEAECRKELDAKNKICSGGLEGHTIVIEAARGAPNGTAFPVTPPRGYMYALSQFSDEILDRACILYVWVTPEESRRKNIARARPDGQSSILYHSVPMEVMLGEYGADDLEYLVEKSDNPDTIKVERPIIVTKDEGKKVYVMKTWYVPVGRLDNRIDLTSFMRDEDWKSQEENKKALHLGLQKAFKTLVTD